MLILCVKGCRDIEYSIPGTYGITVFDIYYNIQNITTGSTSKELLTPKIISDRVALFIFNFFR